jgi:hypothetical protein
MSKGTIPAGAEFNQAEDEHFERSSIQSLKDLSTSDWPSTLGIWIGLKSCHPSTRRRILSFALRLCVERQEPPPAILAHHIDGELGASLVPRARAKDKSLITEVAHYLVRHPRESHRKIAAALGRQRNKSTIHRLFDRSEFWAECAEESARFDDERAHQVLAKYTARFGQTFEYATPETNFAALSCLVPFMIDALEDTAPPLTDETVRAIAAKQSEIRSEAELRRRLLATVSS